MLLRSSFAKLPLLAGALLLGAGASFTAIAPAAMAAEAMTIRYQETTVTISAKDIKQFSRTGILPADLQQFFTTTRQVPENFRTLLTRQISIPKLIEDFLDSSSGEFALLQLDQAISGSSSRQDLNALRTALEEAGRDRKISLLEIMENYPKSVIAVDLSSLEGVYDRVSNFVERYQPAIDTAVNALRDLVCECDTAQATDTGQLASVDGHPHAQTSTCQNLAVSPETASPETPAAEPITDANDAGDSAPLDLVAEQ